ncbi:MAG: hypothetical protein PHD43_23305 [Methylococcales bacterium]|nr:hypothetical protein [Candidatus Paceibacterota bacterium]MDD5323476.1 hypothetical protein [Methylococcales bacterium]
MTKQTSKNERKELERERDYYYKLSICLFFISFIILIIALLNGSSILKLMLEDTQLKEQCGILNITANKDVTLISYETQTSDRYICNFTMQQGESYTSRDLKENCKEMGR